MNDASNNLAQLFDLAAAQCEETLTKEQAEQLQELVIGSPELRYRYILYMHIHALAENGWCLPACEIDPEKTKITELPVEYSVSNDPFSHSPSPLLTFPFTTLHRTISFFSQELPFSLLIATILTGLGLWFASLIYISRPEQMAERGPSSSSVQPAFDPTLEVVGKITGMVDCRWLEEGRVPSGYDNVLLGRQFKLDSGLMEITYKTGAKVILQGPVTYEVEANGGYLSLGKLTGKLEKKVAISPNLSSLSAIHYPLFTIHTPTATVTDLGTEFGVEVNKEGTTTSHVFRGTVEVQMLMADGKAKGNAKVLHENQSARVEKDSSKQGGGNRIAVFVTPSKPTSFVREIPKPSIKILDLVDVVAGGDGFSGRRNAGIDPTDGQIVDRSKGFLIGDRQYHRVEAMPFVDGVFIPDGRTGRVQTDSAGHIFAEFPATANRTSGHIWAAGAIAGQPSANPLHGSGLNRSKLDGVDYASSSHGLLAMHANKAVTFDLEAIRKTNPGYEPLRFCAMTGNTEMESDIGEAVYADVWVLVDGQVRFRRRQINGYNGAFSVIIPIVKNEHFLTLAATDGENGIAADWIIFGDPRLELVSTKAAAGSNPQKTR